MIITERIAIDGKEFIHNYSDAGRYVVRDGVSYDDAIDPVESNRVYSEGDVIPEEEPTDETYAEIGKIMMGVAE